MMNPIPDDPDEVEAPPTRVFLGGLDETLRQEGGSDLPSRAEDPLQESTIIDNDQILTRMPVQSELSGSLEGWDQPDALRKTQEASDANIAGNPFHSNPPHWSPTLEGSTREPSRRGIVGKIEPGQTLYGKYLVLKKLGGGAMGDVWLVRHSTLKSEHALKVIVPNFARNTVALMRFQREFEVMASLRHEHAVTIYDACIDDDGGYIDMEYVDGETIDAVLNHARNLSERDPSAPLMSLEWIVRVLEQLCEVLQVAHDKQIVHRDLKPSNMMLLNGRKPGKEHLKVLDFGIAKVRHDPEGASGHELEASSDKTEGFIGTPSYGSPEQAMSMEDIDGRADLYSVGIMLYEFLTGRLPFRGSPLMVMNQHANTPPPPFHEANPRLRPMPEVEHLVFRILAKDRNNRPSSARELFEEFRESAETIMRSSSNLLTPPTWDSLPFYNPPGADFETIHESRVGGPDLKTTQIDTKVDLVDDSRSNGMVTEPVPAPGIDFARGNTQLWITLGSLAVALLLGFGLSTARFRQPTSGANPAEESKKTARFDTYWPGNYVAVDVAEKDDAWPSKIRQVPEDRCFVRFAEGVYLPEGYSPEDPKQLIHGWPKVIVRDGMRFVRIEGGVDWTMGAWDAQVVQGRTDVPSHPVVLSSFYLQETEVTNGQYLDYLERTQTIRPKAWEGVFFELKKLGLEIARQHPAVNLSRKQANEFAYAIGAKLPTEAQWEYAARSQGEKRRFVWGETPTPSRLLANIETWGTTTTSPVKQYPKDRTIQGAFDMLGNVQEICRDAYATYKLTPQAVADPCELPSDLNQAFYVVRGGSFNSLPGDCALTVRDQKLADHEVAEDVGFRLVLECPTPAGR